jgi:hypothetical protein
MLFKCSPQAYQLFLHALMLCRAVEHHHADYRDSNQILSAAPPAPTRLDEKSSYNKHLDSEDALITRLNSMQVGGVIESEVIDKWRADAEKCLQKLGKVHFQNE